MAVLLLGATAGRTTLNGEGLQHEDGHSHLLAGAIPNCRAYDPTFSYEVAVILQHGMQLAFGAAPRMVSGPVAGAVDILGTTYPAYRLLLIAAAIADRS